MKGSIKITVAAALVATAAMTQPVLAFSNKEAVHDERGNFATTHAGDCVRTKWNADMDECAPPKPEPVVEAAPAPAPRKVMKEYNRSFQVFFDWDEYTLQPSGREVLRNLIAQTRDANAASFSIIGHADRSGPDAYNLGLSEKRTMTVRNELTRLGADPRRINVEWKGESQPLVPTKDGIREPQNRRADIRVRIEKLEIQ
jgi:outer membrane protein OmpA-like peptidoglycan-associated protein